MKLREYVDLKVNEYIANGNKKVSASDRITKCTLTSYGFSEVLFNPDLVSPDAEVLPDEHRDRTQEQTAASIKITYVKPRCRKESTDYIRVMLAE